MNYNVIIDNRQIQWSETALKEKLQGISDLQSKKIAWIKKDLSLSRSTWFTRFIWTAFAKFCNCLRNKLYSVDLNQSQKILAQLQPQLSAPEMKDLFNKALLKFNEIAPKHAVQKLDEKQTQISNDPQQTQKASNRTVANMVTEFLACWNKKTNKYENIPFDAERFKNQLRENNKQFNTPYDLKNDFGYIEKRDLEPGTKVYVRADLHGDLKSLLENLTTLQNQGLLDTNFKCKPGVQLVFLGDYADRGENIVQVLEILSALRMENPQQVILIRGNHEYVSLNQHFKSDDHFHKIIFNKSDAALLESFYQTLPLSVYLGQKNETGVRQYAQFTHGLFELYVDLNDLLNSNEAISQMVIPKKREMGDRIKQIQIDNSIDYEALLKQAKNKDDRKKFKMLTAAKRVIELIKMDQQCKRDVDGTTYNWADVADGNDEGFLSETYISGELYNRYWALSPEDIKAYMRICSNHHKVKMVFRGHSHKMQHHKHNGKIVVSTLPIGAGRDLRWKTQFDKAYILTIGSKVKDWQKVAFTRKPGTSKNDVTKSYSVRDAAA